MILLGFNPPYYCCLVKKGNILHVSYLVHAPKFIKNKLDLTRLIGILQSDSVPTEVSIIYQDFLISL